jgi:hypothetical protein
MNELRGDGGRQAVAHGAARRAELCPVAREPVEAVRPHREVARAVGEDRVVGQALTEKRHHFPQIDVARHRLMAQVLLPLGAGGRRPDGPAGRVDRLERRGRRRELRIAGVDRQVCLVHAAELLGAGVDVDERLQRARNPDERVSLRSGLSEPGADDEQQIGLADPARELRVHTEPDVPDVARRPVVDVVLAAERRADRKAIRLHECLNVTGGIRAPAAAADHRERPLGGREQLAQSRHVHRGRARRDRAVRLGVRCVGLVLGQHILGKGEGDGPGPPRAGGRERARHELGDPGGLLDLPRPLRDLRVEAPVVNLLEGFALAVRAGDLAD